MPLVFSPVDQAELAHYYRPRPRSAFLMLQLSDNCSPAEQEMAAVAREILRDMRFDALTAADVRGTSDFLVKIVDLIRGCGFALAIFSDRTPARTIGNIFFEVGLACLLGKPVQLMLARTSKRGKSPVPSDFVRTEWIQYTSGDQDDLRGKLRQVLDRVEDGAINYYRKLGHLALAAPEPDLELAFERFKQAVLIADDAEARDGITQIRDLLVEAARQRRGDTDDDMASHRKRLQQAVSHFIELLPQR